MSVASLFEEMIEVLAQNPDTLTARKILRREAMKRSKWQPQVPYAITMDGNVVEYVLLPERCTKADRNAVRDRVARERGIASHYLDCHPMVKKRKPK